MRTPSLGSGRVEGATIESYLCLFVCSTFLFRVGGGFICKLPLRLLLLRSSLWVSLWESAVEMIRER